MSIATLARKSRAQRGAGRRSGWTLATTKSGNCPGPCGGGAPAQQHSFRRLMKNKQQGGGPNSGSTTDASGGNCCFTTWKKTNDPKGEQSIGYYLWRKKQLTHNCIKHCIPNRDLSGSCYGPCDSDGCKCNCNKSMGGTACCIVHKTMLPLSNSENIAWVVEDRTCLQTSKPNPRNPNTC